jgi:uncharacterized delta-60 repeat protein
MRGSLLVTFDEEVNNRGFDIIQVTVNGVIRKIIPNDSVNQYSTYLNTGDVVTIGITSSTSYSGLTKQCAVNRLDYTTDDTGGDFGIKNTAVQSTSGTTQFFTATFTATTRPDAYTFHYVVDCVSEIPCYNIGSGYTHTTTPVPAVRDVKVSNGLIYAVGNFNIYNGVPQSGMTVTNLNGSLYSGFTNLGLGGGFNLAVEPLSDGKIYVSTSSYGGVNVNGLCRLNPNGTRDTTFSGLTQNNALSMSDIEVQSDGKIICGGGFTLINGVSRQGICRLNTNGSLDTSFGGISGFTNAGVGPGEINDMDIQTDGKILCIGTFKNYSGTPINNVCRLNTDGTLDNTFTSPIVNYRGFYNLVIEQLSDGKILIGGAFQLVSGGTEYNILKLNTDGTIDTTFIPTTGYQIVRDFEQQPDGKILVTTAGSVGADQYLFRINLDGSIDNTFNITTLTDSNFLTSEVIAINEGLFYVGGGFEFANGTPYNRFVSGFVSNGDLNMCS